MEACTAYEKARDLDAVVRLNLDHMRNPQRAMQVCLANLDRANRDERLHGESAAVLFCAACVLLLQWPRGHG